MTNSATEYKRYLGPFGKKVRDLSWEEVREIWKNNEENLDHWKTYWQSRGYNSWQEWRERFFNRFGTEDLSWTLMETSNSTSWVPHWSYASFRGWNKLSQAYKYGTFYRLTQHEELENYEPLIKLIADFPKETTVIGIELDGDIYIIEGMHRCVAIALAHWQLKKIETNIRVIVGRKTGEKPRFLKTRIQNPVKAELITRLGI